MEAKLAQRRLESANEGLTTANEGLRDLITTLQGQVNSLQNKLEASGTIQSSYLSCAKSIRGQIVQS